MANFPSSISTNANLYIAVNGIQTTLAGNILSTDTTIPLTSTSSFPTTGLVTIENNEVVSYTGISGASLTGCTRGADGTTALAHSTGVTVGLTVVAAHHNLLKDEIIAIETALGASFAKGNLTAGSSKIAVTGGTGAVIGAGATVDIGTFNLGQLSNVSASSPSTNDILQWNGTAWVNYPSAILATASTIAARDSSANLKVNTVIENFATTVTTAGTTTLTVTSAPIQQFTGTTTQTVKLPDCTALAVGYQITILNRSTGSLTVNNNGSVLQKTIPTATQYIFTCTNIGSANGVWDVSSDAGTGTVSSVSGTTNQITSTGGNTPVLAIANPLTLPGPMTAGGAIAMASNKITGLANGTASSDAAAFGQIFTGFQAPAFSTDISGFSTTSSSYQTTALSATITPTSSSHRIKITVTGQLLTNGVTEAIVTIARGTTDLASGLTGFCRLTGVVASTAQRVPAAAVFIDSPGSTSPVTYNVRLKNDNNTGIVAFGAVSATTGVIILEEIV